MEAARGLVPLVLAASREPSTGLAPPALSARRALAALALFSEGDRRKEVFDQLRLELRGPPWDQREAAAQALVFATNAGITDATEDLLDAFAADPLNMRGVHRGWLKERLEASLFVAVGTVGTRPAEQRVVTCQAAEKVIAVATIQRADMHCASRQIEPAVRALSRK